MVRKFFGLAACLGALLLAPNAARADAAEDYVALQTAMKVTQACPGALKFVEYLAIDQNAYDFLQSTGEFQHFRDGRMTKEEYDAWLGGLTGKADEQAKAVGCGQGALAYVLAARAGASARIYQLLSLAFHFGGLPDSDQDFRQLEPGQVEAAQLYEGFLQQVFGDNFQSFATAQQQEAGRRLPQSSGNQTSFSGLGIRNYDDTQRVWELQRQSSETIANVHFEVSAELNGLIVVPNILRDGSFLPTLLAADGSGERLSLLQNPSLYSGVGPRSMPYAIALTPAGKLRVMTWGALGQTIFTEPTLRLYVPKDGPPEGVSNYRYFSEQDWRGGTTMFEGRRLPESCLGAPCYEFDALAVAAMTLLPDGVDSELYIAGAPNTEPPPIEVADFRPGRVYNTYLKQLLMQR